MARINRHYIGSEPDRRTEMREILKQGRLLPPNEQDANIAKATKLQLIERKKARTYIIRLNRPKMCKSEAKRSENATRKRISMQREPRGRRKPREIQRQSFDRRSLRV
jgi:hypothetical protein